MDFIEIKLFVYIIIIMEIIYNYPSNFIVWNGT